MPLNALEFFSKYIEKETGIVFQDSNLYQLKSRLEEVSKGENLQSIEELAMLFLSSQGPDKCLRDRLLDHSTNNETLFFRDPGFFKAIENFIVSEILPLAPKEIRIWSAASSTGQEALSVAMTLDDLHRRLCLPPVKILGTDISHRALRKARSGHYTDFEVRRGLSDDFRDRYFLREGDGWRIRPTIMGKISYDYNNLIRSSVKESFHIILCRNVLIYQTLDMKKNVVQRLFQQIEPGGGLLLGVGETLLGVQEKVTTTMVGNVIFYRRNKEGLIEVA